MNYDTIETQLRPYQVQSATTVCTQLSTLFFAHFCIQEACEHHDQ